MDTDVIAVEPEASQELKKILASNNIEGNVIRIFIASMGCSGPMFNLAKDEVKKNDEHIDFDGLTYVADKSLIKEYEGFDIILLDHYGNQGLMVQPRKTHDFDGCSSCSGCGF